MNRTLNCVMLTDDDPLCNAVNKGLLEAIGCSDYVVKKESALMGIKYLTLSNNPKNNLPFPELIFLNIEMPGIDGWDCLYHFKALIHNFTSSPIIYLLSSYALKQDFVQISNAADLIGLQKTTNNRNRQYYFGKHFVCV